MHCTIVPCLCHCNRSLYFSHIFQILCIAPLIVRLTSMYSVIIFLPYRQQIVHCTINCSFYVSVIVYYISPTFYTYCALYHQLSFLRFCNRALYFSHIFQKGSDRRTITYRVSSKYRKSDKPMSRFGSDIKSPNDE